MSNEQRPVIELEGLSKEYVVRTRAGRFRRTRRVVEAVSDIDLRIEAGEMVGYLGPNGAGKSTTIKMVTGILTPTSGRACVLGFEPSLERRSLARHLGVVFGQRSQLWWDLPLVDSFDLLHRRYRTDSDRHRANLDELVGRLDLGMFLETPVRQLSLGQRMRGELTAALLHDPALVVLDEPTIGLDVVSKYAVRAFLAEMNAERGTTVLLTTHDLDDVEQLCRRMLVIDDGQILLDSSLPEFRATYGNIRHLVVEFEVPCGPIELPGIEVTRVDGPTQTMRFDRRDWSAADLVGRVAADHAVRDITVTEPRIDELLHEIYAEPGPGSRHRRV